MIDSYRFGHIVIDGKGYESDVIIFSDHVQDRWWRKSGHSLVEDDLIEIIQSKPEVLIIGCGADGVLTIPKETKNYIRQQGIQLIAFNTGKACEIFNQLCKEKRVVAGLHLTC